MTSSNNQSNLAIKIKIDRSISLMLKKEFRVNYARP